MFRKFDKIYRVKVPQYDLPANKGVLSDKERKLLLSGNVTIEEKLDGANVAIVRCKQDPGFRLQKRGSFIGPSEHAQYRFFVNWAASNTDKLLRIPMDWIVYVELLYAKHHILYTKLPSYVVVTDVWDGDMYIERDRKERMCKELELSIVPLISYGAAPAVPDLVKLITKSSYYDGLMEGVVIKNYKCGIRGKIVRMEFMKEIDEDDHWSNKPVTKNELAVGAEALA